MACVLFYVLYLLSVISYATWYALTAVDKHRGQLRRGMLQASVEGSSFPGLLIWEPGCLQKSLIWEPGSRQHAYCLLPMPMSYCLLPSAYCLFPIAYCLALVAYRTKPSETSVLVQKKNSLGGILSEVLSR